MFLTLRSQQLRQLMHLLPWSEAGQLFISVETVDVHGQKPGAGPFILVPEILIIKLGGIMSGSMY